jgi:hypothetical protein
MISVMPCPEVRVVFARIVSLGCGSIPAIEQPARDHLGLDLRGAFEDRENAGVA